MAGVRIILIGAGAAALALGTADARRATAPRWTLDVRHDAFADATACRLRSADRRMLYRPGAVGFRFAHRRDTLAATYRVDGGPPVRWQDRYPALVAAHVAIDGRSLDDPTAGIVWLPEREVLTARSVAIRLTPHDRPHVFALAGLAERLDEAARRGCTIAPAGAR